VEWDGLRRVREPVAYTKRRAEDYGTFVVDPDRRVVYFYHWNQ
jgi:hypothetical protein